MGKDDVDNGRPRLKLFASREPSARWRNYSLAVEIKGLKWFVGRSSARIITKGPKRACFVLLSYLRMNSVQP